MIKQTALVLAALVAGVSAQADTAPAAAAPAKSDLSVTVDVSYVSSYVFRGQHVTGDAIQPSIEVAYGDFYAGAWHSDDVANTAVETETDYYAGYGYKLNDTFSLDGGVTRYTYNGGHGTGAANNDSTEIYVGAKAKVLLTPAVYYYYDFDRDVSTFEGSVGYSLPIDAIKASLDLSGKLGYVQIPGDGADYTYGVLGASVPYKLSETATFTVGVDYVLNDQRGLKSNGRSSDELVGKAGVSIGF